MVTGGAREQEAGARDERERTYTGTERLREERERTATCLSPLHALSSLTRTVVVAAMPFAPAPQERDREGEREGEREKEKESGIVSTDKTCRSRSIDKADSRLHQVNARRREEEERS